MSRVQCAIYTRKSSEEGLEQEFNSLDAQYDACKSYIASQRHEGWSLVRERYDDGGFSGGRLERRSMTCMPLSSWIMPMAGSVAEAPTPADWFQM